MNNQPADLETSSFPGVTLLYLVIATILLSPIFANAPLTSRGEARETVVVQNMFQQNNLILPLRNGDTIPSKPPMFHWSGVAVTKLLSPLFGDQPTPLTSRLPSAIYACWALLLLYTWVKCEVGVEAGIISALILGTSLNFVRYSQLGRVDLTFVTFQLIATISLYYLFKLNHKSSRTAELFCWLLVAGVSSACAVLTKGPAGLAFPWATAGLWSLVTRKLTLTNALAASCALVLALLLAGWWYLSAYQIGGQSFVDIQLMRENVARVVGLKKYETGHGGFFLMGPVLFVVGLLPWSLVSIRFLYRFLRSSPNLSRSTLGAVYSKLTDLEKYLWISVILHLVVFTLTASIRDVYFLPCYPAAAVLLALSLLRSGKLDYWLPWIRRASFGVVMILLLGAPFVRNVITTRLSPEKFIEAELKNLDGPLYCYRTEFYPVAFYLNRPIPFSLPNPLPNSGYAVMQQSDVEQALNELPNATIVATSDNYAAYGEKMVLMRFSSVISGHQL